MLAFRLPDPMLGAQLENFFRNGLRVFAVRQMTKLLSILLVVAAGASCFEPPDVAAILRQSVQVTEQDWRAAPEYDYFERDRKDGGTRTYHLMMIEGSPYSELVAINGKPLRSADQQEEQRKLQQAISQRQSESASDRAQRIAKYEQERKRDHLLMEQLTRAFNFRLLGQRRLDGHAVYLLQATPRPGYQPPNTDSEVLTGMQGKLWIDKATYQWVKVEATVVHPVSIAGFLAQVQPGTRFELEKMPVADGIWLPRHFAEKSNARILFLFRHHTQEDETYFDYQKASTRP